MIRLTRPAQVHGPGSFSLLEPALGASDVLGFTQGCAQPFGIKTGIHNRRYVVGPGTCCLRRGCACPRKKKRRA